MGQPVVRFKSVLTQHDLTVVVEFSGRLDKSIGSHLDDYWSCIRFYLDAGAVVFDFSGTTHFLVGAFPTIAELQATLRQRGMDIRICGLKSKFREKALEKSLFRESDMFPSLKTSLFPRKVLSDRRVESVVKRSA